MKQIHISKGIRDIVVLVIRDIVVLVMFLSFTCLSNALWISSEWISLRLCSVNTSLGQSSSLLGFVILNVFKLTGGCRMCNFL